MDFIIFFTVIYILYIIVGFYMLYRNFWVHKVRVNAIGSSLYDELIDYDEMTNNHIFTYDINKMKKPGL